MNRRRGSTARKKLTMNTDVATNKSTTANEATPKTKRAGKKAKTAKAATKAANKNEKARAKRKSQSQREAASTKKEIVLELLRRKEGATIAKIGKATDWQNHSIRGFISGTVSKKMGLAVESSANEAKERTYRIAM
jgi:Protein of unknown function (DUF3489)